MKQLRGFGEGFPPKSIGIVGVSRSKGVSAPGYSGLELFRNLRDSGFLGRVYPINPKADKIDGTKVYPDVASVPELLDLVAVAVPAAVVPGVLEDCSAAGVRNVLIYTSGFAETGTEQGRMLDLRVREIVSAGNLRVIGPNCMGFHVPSVGLRMFNEVDMVRGPVAFISQSGGHARTFLVHGPDLGIGFSKVISFGNALTLGAVDFLEYLVDDPETRIICMYIEGVRDGRRLTDLVKQVNAEKPVIIWKGGLTESGARASASHTGSLTGERRIWEAFFKQTGAIQVRSFDEMTDAVVSILNLKPIHRPRAAVLGIGGGATVANGDVCAEEGLVTPPLSSKTLADLSEFIPLVNQGMANPMDVPIAIALADNLQRALDRVCDDPEIDIIVLCLAAEYFAGTWGLRMPEFKECLIKHVQEHPDGKPVVVAIIDEGYLCHTEKSARELREAGITVFPTLSRACRAIRRCANYRMFTNKRNRRELDASFPHTGTPGDVSPGR